MVLRTLARIVALGAVVAILVLLVASSGARLDRADAAIGTGEDPVYLPKAEYLRPMSLGWQNVLADVLWFRTINYFGSHYQGDRTYPWLAHMCDLVTDLDPLALHVYRFAGVILPWEAEQADAGIRILEKGVRHLPDSWLLHYFLGFNYYFFKDDHARALEYLERAVALPGVHPSIARLAARLAAHQYGPDATLAFLQEMQESAGSSDVREVLAEQMREAQLAADLTRLGAARDAYRERAGREPVSVQALVDAGLLAAAPADPFGGQYEFDPDTGAPRSSTGRTPSKLHQSRVRERALQGESLRDL